MLKSLLYSGQVPELNYVTIRGCKHLEQDMNEVSRMGCMPALQPMVQGELNPPFDGKLSDFSLTVKNPGVRTPSTTPIKALPLQILFKLEGRVDVSMIFSRLRSLGIYR